MLKEIKEDVEKLKKMMCEQTGNINKEKILQKFKKKFWNEKIHYKDSKSDVKAEESVSELEDRTMEMITYKEQKEKRLKKTKQGL